MTIQYISSSVEWKSEDRGGVQGEDTEVLTTQKSCWSHAYNYIIRERVLSWKQFLFHYKYINSI